MTPQEAQQIDDHLTQIVVAMGSAVNDAKDELDSGFRVLLHYVEAVKYQVRRELDADDSPRPQPEGPAGGSGDVTRET